MRRFVLWSMGLVMLALLLAAVSVATAFYWFTAPGGLAEDRVVMIAPGTGFAAIAQQLEDERVVSSALLFKALAVWNQQHRSVKAGEYQFYAMMSPQAVLRQLTEGKAITHAVTLPEGLTTQAIVARLMADERLAGDVPEGVTEASLLPDTYHIHRGDDRAQLVQRMQLAMQQTLAELWEKRAEGLPIKTPQEAVILASVVERETGLDGERGLVASVFVNRLRKGMPLQSDPTVIYGIELKDGPMGRALWRKDLKIDHPYNTYVHKGLPAGPICHPGREALEAVLNPPQTDWLYFVATGKGGHHFAKNLRDHNRNVARYKAVLRQQ